MTQGQEAMSATARWTPRPLKTYLVSNESGVWGEDPRDDGTDVFVLRSTEIALDGSWRIEDPAMRRLSAAERRRFLVESGDVLIVKSSGSEAHIGKTAIVTASVAGMPASFSNFIQRLRPSPEINPRYLWYLLNSRYGRQHLAFLSNTTTGLQNLTAGTIGSLMCPGPPAPEQCVIADYLDVETARIDRLARAYQALGRELHEKRRALTLSGVSGAPIDGRRRDSDVPWVRRVPEHWQDVKLTLVARLGSGHTPSRGHPEWWTDCTIPWITTGEVWQIREDRIEYLTETREMISEEGLANSAAELCPAGTVVLSRTASAGFSAIMGKDMATSQDYVTWQCGPRLRPRYLLLCLRAMRRDLLERLAMGSTHQTIYIPDIQSIRIPLAPVHEQDAIVEWVWERLRAIDAILDALDGQMELLRERRQALINAAVTGQLEIPGMAA